MSLDPETVLGIKAAVLKAGAAGTLVGIIWRRQYRLAEAFSAAVAGMGSAMYIGPAAGAWFDVAKEDIHSGIVFSCGLLGMYIVDAASLYGPRLVRAILSRILPPDDRPDERRPDDSKREGGE